MLNTKQCELIALVGGGGLLLAPQVWRGRQAAGDAGDWIFNTAHHYWSWQIGRLILEYRLDDNPPLAARAYALQNITSLDAGIACWDSKYAYWAIRPVQLDPDVKPLFSTPNHPSYPAAHGCLSTATAIILGYLFPRDTAKLAALGEEAAESRIWAGIHYRSDTVAGTALGRAVANKVIDRARKDGSQ
jgi:membrane-associated phospholipid phosphatase